MSVTRALSLLTNVRALCVSFILQLFAMAGTRHRHVRPSWSMYSVLAVLAITFFVLPRESMCQGGIVQPPFDPPVERACEPLVEITVCTSIYKNASFPNFRDHSSQSDANQELLQFLPLIEGGCSNAIVHFLCSIYAPFCQVGNPDIITPPCRELCEHVFNGCEKPLSDFGLPWPPHLTCTNFPLNATSKTDFCPNNIDTLKIPPIFNVVPPEIDPVVTSTPVVTTSSPVSRLSCLQSLQVTSSLKNRSYSFGGVRNCGVNCSGLYFTPLERNIIAPVFILLFAVICVLFTLFTVATFLIDRRRFHYPERPIIFISFCYLVVSLVYIVGTISKLSGRQNQAFSCSDEISVSNDKLSSSFVFQSLPNSESTFKTASCVILFVVVYFFQMASSVWWVILTLTWFLAAALKWGEEAVEKMWMLYHVLAWGIPAIQVILVLALQLVDGDQLSGLCYTGNANNIGLGVFILLPLLLYLVVGIIFVVIGFTALVNIKKQLERDLAKSRKIGRLILRVGIYSVLYVSPNVILLLILVYELAQKRTWEDAHLKECINEQPGTCRGNPDPSFAAFLLKYIMLFLVGIFSTTWILSSKTFAAWHKLFCSCCAIGSPAGAYESTNNAKGHNYDVPKHMHSPQYVTGHVQHHYEVPNPTHYVMAAEKKDLTMNMSHPHTAV